MIPVRQYWNLLVDYLRPYRPRVVLLAVLVVYVFLFFMMNRETVEVSLVVTNVSIPLVFVPVRKKR